MAVLTVLVSVVAVWFGKEKASDRRRKRFLARHRERSVKGIAARIAKEREQERVAHADTEVFPVVPPADDPTEQFPPAVPLPKRVRGYVRRAPTPYPRKPLNQPDPALMQRVLEGLQGLSDDPHNSHPRKER
ncbi:hypothetical protein [Amycolatopsis sp. cmx-11-51]|uniref:hypothetical protein n=1 Tax=Amycolatopsis sp. cmx-11-51 TaxID=2785797 RepID=UPI0039E2A6DC